MKTQFIGITRVLALAAVTNFDFVDEESKWRGSEIHRMIQLYDEHKLDEKTVPEDLKGYLAAHKKFMAETGFVPTRIEFNVQSKQLGLRGRIDRAGLLKGKRCIVDFKSGSINPAVALQLCLGGYLLDPAYWWSRIAVQLKPTGKYSVKHFYLMEWHADLATALACVRIAQWKVKQGLV